MNFLAPQLDAVRGGMPFKVVGQVSGISGLTIEASDIHDGDGTGRV